MKILKQFFKKRITSQIIRTMKISTFFLMVCLFQAVAGRVYSQEQEITLKENSLSLEKLFQQIEKMTDYHFLYRTEGTLDLSKKVDINAQGSKVREVLNKVLYNTDLEYKLVGDKLIVIASVSQQKQRVTGKVTDQNGEGLVGVTVFFKGTSRGGITDINGNYSIPIVSGDKVLVYSFIGMIKKEVTIGTQTMINVKMEMEATTLNEVVVVAFGTQKKTDLVGSVTSVKMSDLKVPSSNLTQALAGRVAGVIAFQRSGEPGQDNADFFIRGVTTFGYKTSPLILIDGMELTTKDLARLQPDDISSFSIMKDATSTALYGARGANGVILVTTKQGKVGKASLSFRMENSISTPTTNVQLADPVTYMKMANEAVLTRNPLGVVLYSDEKIANTAAGLNPVVYPANDWKKLLFKENTMVQRMTLNVSGGGGVARYFISGSYNKDNGILKVDNRNNFNNNIDLKSYTLRSNITIDVTKTTEMMVRLSGNFDDYQGPIDGGAGMYSKVMRSNPVLFPAYYPVDAKYKYVKHILFGNYDQGQYENPYADMVKGYKDYSSSLMLAQIEAKQDLSFLAKGLSFRTMVNTNRNSYFDVSRYYNPYFYKLGAYDKLEGIYQIAAINDATGTEYLGYNEGPKTISSTFYMESMLNYSNTFNKKHSLSGLLVYMMRNNLNANSGDLQQSLPFRNLGMSGRGTYAYDNRYFAEFNFGYNGSERFYEKKRYGFFPSAGLAWSISNEKFFQPIKKVVSNLRLRTTYGLIGNDAIGSASDRFFYLSNVNMNDGSRGASFGRDPGGYSLNGVSISRYGNQDITWETSLQKNIALEIGLFNKVNIQAEYYTQMRDNILMTRSAVPVTMGFTAPIRANVGKASGKGTDLSIDYSEIYHNGLSVSIRGNFTYATSKFEVYEEPKYPETYRSRVGNSIYQNYGYFAERLFVDDAEAANSPKQNFGLYGGGDIKYLDVNKDGQITEADKIPIGNPTLPEITYGFGFSASYKGLDASAFFQGLANESFWINPWATSPFQNETQVLKAYADSYWSEDHRDVNALWPRLSPTISSNNTQTSTWFMRDGSFLRLKQVEIGYTIPGKIQAKMHTSNLRFYVNATNLLNFSKFKLWDVEMGGNGLGYPIQKVINIGLNVSFN